MNYEKIILKTEYNEKVTIYLDELEDLSKAPTFLELQTIVDETLTDLQCTGQRRIEMLKMGKYALKMDHLSYKSYEVILWVI